MAIDRSGAVTRRLSLATLFIIALFAAVSAQEGSARFPAASQVAADYRDDARQYAALVILQDEIDRVSGKPMPHADYQRRVEYTHAINNIVARHMGKGGLQSKELKAFSARSRPLEQDETFRREVTTRYGTSALAIEQSPPGPPGPPDPDATIMTCLGILLVTGIAAVIASWSVTRRSFVKAHRRDLSDAPSGLPELPTPLKQIELPGMMYNAGLISGLVLDKETRTQVIDTVVVQNQPYLVDLNVYHSSLSWRHTRTIVQHDIYRVRTPSGNEAFWSFAGGTLQAGAGQVISAITKALTRDRVELIAAYNHHTGELVEHLRPGTHRARFRYGWLAGTVVGTIGMSSAGLLWNEVFPRDNAGDPIRQVIGVLGIVGMSILTAGFLSLLVTYAILGIVRDGRNTYFRRHYMPRVKQFFGSGTDRFKAHFRETPQRGR